MANPYFPGDPPWPETIGLLSAYLLGACVVLVVLTVVVTRRFPRVRKSVLVLIAVPIAAGLAGAGYFIVKIGTRHFGDWAKLKAELRRTASVTKGFAKGPDGILTDAEFDKAEEAIAAMSPRFQFKGTSEPVTIRVVTKGWPYVGVDFGDGANAWFDLNTMICTYSD